MAVTQDIEVSIVMPCLNEAETLEACIAKARKALEEHAIDGEILVADNGSTDGSVDLAQRMGARVIHVRARGYGNALMAGIAAARGKYIIMGDADDSYDFLEVPRFVESLRQGYDLVQGCRLPAGGGRSCPEQCHCSIGGGAIPCFHSWPGAGSKRRFTTCTAGCEGSPESSTTSSTSDARAWSSRRDDHQIESAPALVSEKSRSPCILTVARRTRLIYERSATAGVRCGSS